MDKTQTQQKQWKDVNGIMYLYARMRSTADGTKFYAFSTSIGRKNDNDTYDNVYFDVIFADGIAPKIKRDGTYTIDIKKGFITLRKYNDTCKHCVVIMEYDLLD